MIKTRMLALSACAFLAACASHEKKPMDMAAMQPAAKPSLRLTLLPQEPIAAGHTVTVLAKLTNMNTRAIVTADDLETVHGSAFHLMIADANLSDYQHVHPQATALPGVYSFSFTPKLPGGYRAWADVTPKATEKEEFDMADLGKRQPTAIAKVETRQADMQGLHLALAFDTPPVAGGESEGTITISDHGAPVTRLEPVMGSFAHIVGFYDDYRTIMHVHPEGSEPQSPIERGGPELRFHLMPPKAGFVKLFVQLKLGGKDVFVPFGVNVAAGKAP